MQDSFTDSGTYTLKDGQISPNKLWKCIYASCGIVGQRTICSPQNGKTGKCIYMRPKSTTDTLACLVLSEQTFKDFDMSFSMRTLSQNKSPTRSEDWETAWVMFRYTDKLPNGKQTEDYHHHYYMYIGKSGMIEVGKKDYIVIPNGLQTPDGVNHVCNIEQQQYLTTEKRIKFALKKWFKVRLVVKGRNIKVYVDKKLQVDITDDGTIGYDSCYDRRPIGYPASDIMSSGKVGFYSEDSAVEFNDILVTEI